MYIYITSKARSQWTLLSLYLPVVILGASDRAVNKTQLAPALLQALQPPPAKL